VQGERRALLKVRKTRVLGEGRKKSPSLKIPSVIHQGKRKKNQKKKKDPP